MDWGHLPRLESLAKKIMSVISFCTLTFDTHVGLAFLWIVNTFDESAKVSIISSIHLYIWFSSVSRWHLTVCFVVFCFSTITWKPLYISFKCICEQEGGSCVLAHTPEPQIFLGLDSSILYFMLSFFGSKLCSFGTFGPSIWGLIKWFNAPLISNMSQSVHVKTALSNLWCRTCKFLFLVDAVRIQNKRSRFLSQYTKPKSYWSQKHCTKVYLKIVTF